MSQGSSDNPYQAPQIAAEPHAKGEADLQLTDLIYLRRFRWQMHLLGGTWLTLAIVVILAMVAAHTLTSDDFRFRDPIVSGVLLVCAAIYTILGVAICYKQIWAVIGSLILTYLAAIANLLRFNVCPLILAVGLIVLAHGALASAKALKRRGVSLRRKVSQRLASPTSNASRIPPS